MMEHPIKIDDLGGNPTILGNPHIWVVGTDMPPTSRHHGMGSFFGPVWETPLLHSLRKHHARRRSMS